MAELGETNSTRELINVSADAMSNMYEVYFTVPDANEEYISGFKVRTSSFSPTSFSHSTYELHYKSLSIIKPTSKIEGSRTFDITFRLDVNYNVYSELKKWQSKILKTSSGYANTGVPKESLGNITVYSLANASTIGVFDESFLSSKSNAVWKYDGVWISRITEPEFTYASSDPINITATFNFTTATYPFQESIS